MVLINKKGFIIIWDWRYFAFIAFVLVILFVWGLADPEGYTEFMDDEDDYEHTSSYFYEDEYYTEELIYYDFMFFNHSEITYDFARNYSCLGDMIIRMKKSFKIIEEETEGIIKFRRDLDNPDILIRCHSTPHEWHYGGLGGSIYYETGQIVNGEIDMYPHEKGYYNCEDYPTTELHELLHVFGFDHINDKDSIMFSGFDSDDPTDLTVGKCEEIDEEIVECLKDIYSDKENVINCENLPFLFLKPKSI